MPEKRPAISVSLDYCLLHGDSLALLARFLLRYAVRHGRFRLGRQIFLLSRRREAQDISRRRFKFELMRLFRRSDGKLIDRYVAHIYEKLNKKVVRKIEEARANSYVVVLATNAPDEYVAPFAEKFGADGYLCTPSLSEFRRIYPSDPIDYVECAGIDKVNRLNRWLDANNAELRTVITGETDDLPLLRLKGPADRYLTSPSRSMRRMLRREGILFESL